jgi:hypothetical protein
MAVVSFVGTRQGLDTVNRGLADAGYRADLLPARESDEHLVAARSVKGSAGEEVASEVLRSLVDELREADGVWLLAVADGQARKITWVHDGDECVAEIGFPLKWRTPDKKRADRFGPWHYGQTVWLIEPGPPCWNVSRDFTQRPDGWAQPLLCGDPTDLEWVEE